MVLTAGARGTTYTPSIKLLEKRLKIPESSIKNTFKKINTISIQYAASIILHKRKIENNQTLPLVTDTLVRGAGVVVTIFIFLPYTSSTKPPIYNNRSNEPDGIRTRTTLLQTICPTNHPGLVTWCSDT